MFDSKNSAWPDPEQSIGEECKSFSGQKCWQVVGPALEAMEKLSLPIKELLDKHQEILEQGEPKPRAISFDMWMVGSTSVSAAPTLVITSKSRRQRTYAKVLVKESKLLNIYPGMKIKTLDKAPAILRAAQQVRDDPLDDILDDGIYMIDDSRGYCGALIAFGRSRLATMGSVLLINGIQYGFSAQHARFGSLQETEIGSNESESLCFDDDSDSEEFDLVDITSRGKLMQRC